MEPLNNSFPCYYFHDKYEVDLEEKSNLCNISAFNLNFNFSPPKKKNTIDISYSMEEQTFYENSHINIEEEFQPHNEETCNYLKIGNEGQNPCIDPIQEVDSFERENNESFLHENNYLFDNFNDTSSFESSNGVPSDLIKFDSTMDETDIGKLRRNIMSLILSKTTGNINNKSDINIMYGNISNSNAGNQNFSHKKPIFLSSSLLNKSSYVGGNNTQNPQNHKLNLSCNLSTSLGRSRGRKKFLFDGVKTEIIDKAFLREFKCYLKKSKVLLRNTFEELKTKPEEKNFWNEFKQNNNPPFIFTSQNNKKIEFKSFSKSFLKFVFSHQSVRSLYSVFIKDKEKEIVDSILNKKIKKIDRKLLLFYSFYGKNIHKLYSNDYNASDINMDELEIISGSGVNSGNSIGNRSSSGNVNIFDSLTGVNNSAI